MYSPEIYIPLPQWCTNRAWASNIWPHLSIHPHPVSPVGPVPPIQQQDHRGTYLFWCLSGLSNMLHNYLRYSSCVPSFSVHLHIHVVAQTRGIIPTKLGCGEQIMFNFSTLRPWPLTSNTYQSTLLPIRNIGNATIKIENFGEVLMKN